MELGFRAGVSTTTQEIRNFILWSFIGIPGAAYGARLDKGGGAGLVMNGEDRTLCVTVDGTKRVVSGVNWKTTARDVIQKLRPRSGPQILLESWRGCVRPVHEDEYICQLLEEWGAEAERVQLVILSSHSLPGYRLAKPGLNTAQIYRAQRHGKVSSNKKRCLSRLTTPKKKIAEEIERLIAKAQAAQERLSAVKELQHTLTDITPPQVMLQIAQ